MWLGLSVCGVIGSLVLLGPSAVPTLTRATQPSITPAPAPHGALAAAEREQGSQDPSESPAPVSVTASSPAPENLRYVAIGGGPTPEYTEVSLEQDLGLAQRVLQGPGELLFAGGAQSASVRVNEATGEQPGHANLLAKLGDVFDPRASRTSHYRQPHLAARPATEERSFATIERALRAGEAPLFVYMATHGSQGETPRDNFVELWGGDPWSVVRLDELTQRARRPVRFAIASCYSGGFAELAFAHADAGRGAAEQTRCGVFAATWDRQASGCDPNPDRRAQEAYSLHMLHALAGEDRDGKALPRAKLDLNGDGQIGLLEAHTRARIACRSIDVPTTTSERYLREVQRDKAAPALTLLPEDAQVVKQLGAQLGLENTAAAERQHQALSDDLDALAEAAETAQAALDRAQKHLAVALLSRWPVLSDPYHAQFAATLAHEARAIERVLDQSVEAETYLQAREHYAQLTERANALEVDEALALRLVRAHETLALLGGLAARGGEDFEHYRALLECERGRP